MERKDPVVRKKLFPKVVTATLRKTSRILRGRRYFAPKEVTLTKDNDGTVLFNRLRIINNESNEGNLDNQVCCLLYALTF